MLNSTVPHVNLSTVPHINLSPVHTTKHSAACVITPYLPLVTEHFSVVVCGPGPQVKRVRAGSHAWLGNLHKNVRDAMSCCLTRPSHHMTRKIANTDPWPLLCPAMASTIFITRDQQLSPGMWEYQLHSPQWPYGVLHMARNSDHMEYSIWHQKVTIWSTPCGAFLMPYGVL